ncbi:hypothetical protein F4774DRAFT_410255 [Daldinia eschscholtzii]|nr:hypothetical protein F4774DRAFT_410255 [Daldinia eschscholtzii]
MATNEDLEFPEWKNEYGKPQETEMVPTRPLGSGIHQARLKKERIKAKREREQLERDTVEKILRWEKWPYPCIGIFIFLAFVLYLVCSQLFPHPPAYDENIVPCQVSRDDYRLLWAFNTTGFQCQSSNLAPMLAKDHPEYNPYLPDASVLHDIDTALERLIAFENESFIVARETRLRACKIEYQLNWYLNISSLSTKWYMTLRRWTVAAELQALALVLDNEASTTYRYYIKLEKDMSEMLKAFHEKQQAFCSVISNIHGYLVRTTAMAYLRGNGPGKVRWYGAVA